MPRLTAKDLEAIRRRQAAYGVHATVPIASKPARRPRTVDGAAFAAWLEGMCKGPGIFIAVRTFTPGNEKNRHWAKTGKSARKEREAAKNVMLANRYTLPAFPVRVKLTRFGPGRMDRHNLPGAMKHVIDGIADFYGVDDGDPRWQFEFDQDRSKFYGVRIEVSAINPKAEVERLMKLHPDLQVFVCGGSGVDSMSEGDWRTMLDDIHTVLEKDRHAGKNR